jgi:addiction module RelE/StbE family toxin
MAKPAAPPYDIQLTSSARRDLDRLPEKVAEVVFRFLDGPLRENPMRVTKPLTGKYSGYRTGRIGPSWRIIVKIDQLTVVVTVIRVSPRADAYR